MTYPTRNFSRRVSIAMLDALALLFGMAIAMPFFLVMCLPFVTGV